MRKLSALTKNVIFARAENYHFYNHYTILYNQKQEFKGKMRVFKH